MPFNLGKLVWQPQLESCPEHESGLEPCRWMMLSLSIKCNRLKYLFHVTEMSDLDPHEEYQRFPDLCLRKFIEAKVPVESLSAEDLFQAFHLKMHPQEGIRAFALFHKEVYWTPSSLEAKFQKWNKAFHPRRAPSDNALCICWKVQALLEAAITDEKRSRKWQDIRKLKTCIHKHAKVGFKSTTPDKHFGNLRTSLLWYDGAAASGTKFLVLNFQSPFEDPRIGEAYCLAYMGTVHRIRLEANMTDVVVYGLYTDSFCYTFYRIDDSSQVSRIILQWMPFNNDMIYSIIRKIIREAIETAEGKHAHASDSRQWDPCTKALTAQPKPQERNKSRAGSIAYALRVPVSWEQ